MTMRRLFSGSWLGLSCLALLAQGCGQNSFTPPRRSKPLPTVGASAESKAKFLILVVPKPLVGDLEVWAMRAQHEANDKRAIFRTMAPRRARPKPCKPRRSARRWPRGPRH